MNSKPQQTIARRQQRIGILWLLSALLTLIAAYAGYRLYLAHKIKTKIALIRKAGLPVTTAELNQWYAAVPPQDNTALILTNAFAIWSEGTRTRPICRSSAEANCRRHAPFVTQFHGNTEEAKGIGMTDFGRVEGGEAHSPNPGVRV